MNAHNLASRVLTEQPRTENVEAEGWVRVGPEQHEFHVTEFKYPHFFSVAATISISPSTMAHKLREKGFTGWQKHGLYSIGHISPEGLITVMTPAVGGRLFPRDAKETYLYEVAQVLGFHTPKFVGKPSIAADYVSKREAQTIQPRSSLGFLRSGESDRARNAGDRLFVGIFPTGIGYADSSREVHGDYKRLAFLPFSTLEIEWEKNVPAGLRKQIESNAQAIQARRGEDFQVSTMGQTVRLGNRAASSDRATGMVRTADAEAHAIADRLTERQRATLAWLLENWPYPYRGSPREDVDGLVSLGLLEPYTEDAWGDVTRLGHRVWFKRARKQWRDETDVGARFRHAKYPGLIGSGSGNRAAPSDLEREQVETIARQLGGGTGRLAAMIGAHSFAAGPGIRLSFRFRARARNGSNAVQITLEPSDTYRVVFMSARGKSLKLKGQFEDVYADGLRGLFERETGLYLSL